MGLALVGWVVGAAWYPWPLARFGALVASVCASVFGGLPLQDRAVCAIASSASWIIHTACNGKSQGVSAASAFVRIGKSSVLETRRVSR